MTQGSRPSKKETRAAKREEARKARIEAQKRAARAKKMRNYGILALLAIVVIAGIVFLFSQRSRSAEAVEKARIEAGCSDITEHDEEGSGHIEATETVEYETNPPSSGDHRGNTAPWGPFPDRVDDEILVHNLEHGGVVIHYRAEDLSEGDIRALEELVESYPDPGSGSGVISNPNPDIPQPIGMASWAHTQTCERFNIVVIKAFIEERCGKGPEKFPLGCA